MEKEEDKLNILRSLDSYFDESSTEFVIIEKEEWDFDESDTEDEDMYEDEEINNTLDSYFDDFNGNALEFIEYIGIDELRRHKIKKMSDIVNLIKKYFNCKEVPDKDEILKKINKLKYLEKFDEYSNYFKVISHIDSIEIKEEDTGYIKERKNILLDWEEELRKKMSDNIVDSKLKDAFNKLRIVNNPIEEMKEKIKKEPNRELEIKYSYAYKIWLWKNHKVDYDEEIDNGLKKVYS